MQTLLLVIHIIVSFIMVVVILLQSGKGGGMGSGFGGAAAVGQQIFGGRGAATFLGKLTVALGATFFVTSMALAWYSSRPQSALDLSQTAGTPVESQVEQVIEEGGSAAAPVAPVEEAAPVEESPEAEEAAPAQESAPAEEAP
ncbi:preprotein translocase subunit SecG [Lujinxingia litoralis]|uniref:Protein-export membrane protein SecG n=1 Tax=Lujinxingia litoralis TaxID=2211119 RepID=A0A328CCE5_9DELT|nr:preprotein translocase subunit SecG [Lujinxingia litoralis]RAL24871.1 preprotein translocase subunit SecG [Lujinxingia litoralis]